MNVTLCSAFRNAEERIAQYRLQVCPLAYALKQRGDALHVIWCEGDSSDNTFLALLHAKVMDADHCCFTADIFQHHHGQLDYGSVVHPIRFASLAKVWNEIWRRIPADSDAVVFIESDLEWQPSVILALIDHLACVPCAAPMVMLRREGWPAGWFYDFWGGRKDGKHINALPPYFPNWDMKEPIQVDSMGSCLVMRGDLARQLHWPPEDVVVGVCRQIYELGESVWLDPKATVYHQ